MGTVPIMRDWQPGDLATHTLLNAQVRDPVQFQNDRPWCFMSRLANQSITGSTWDAVNWTYTVVDNDNMHAGGSTQEFVIQTPGCYELRASAVFAANATGRRAIRWDKLTGFGGSYVGTHTASGIDSSYGSTLDGDTGNAVITALEVITYRVFDPGETARVAVWQNSGGALDLWGDMTSSHLWSWASVRWIAAS
jgi:hypothetical protein